MSSSMSTKAAIWARVSTDRQHEDNQIPDLERLCEHRGWEIARRYEIADASAYKGEHRQALQRMLDDAHQGEFSVLVIWAVDRLCRQGIEELLRLIRELRERNVSLVSHQEPLAQRLRRDHRPAGRRGCMGRQAGVRAPLRADPRRPGAPQSSGQADRRRRLQARQRQTPASHRGVQAGMGATQVSPVGDAILVIHGPVPARARRAADQAYIDTTPGVRRRAPLSGTFRSVVPHGPAPRRPAA